MTTSMIKIIIIIVVDWIESWKFVLWTFSMYKLLMDYSRTLLLLNLNGPTKFDMQNLRNGDNSDLELFTLKNKTKQEQQ